MSGINNLRQIVGTYGGIVDHQGFLLSNGVYSTIEVPFEGATRAISINDRGDILGESFGYNGNGVWRDFLIADGVVTTVNVPEIHASSSNPKALAWDRTIVGDYRVVAGRWLGYVRGPNGKYFGMTIAGARNVHPTSINNVAGKIVGMWQDANFEIHAFVYDYKSDLGAMEVLNGPPVDTAAAGPMPIRTVPVENLVIPDRAYISGINAHGVITGYCLIDDESYGLIGTPGPSLSQTKP